MKATAVIMIVLALLIGIVPQFSDCAAEGRSLTLENGRQIPMKCHWTARAEMAVAAPLLATGGLLAFAKRKETKLFLSALGAVLGVFVILLPTALVGVCANPEMICNSFMLPFLVLTGSLVVALNLYVIVAAVRSKEDLAWGYTA